MTTDEQNFEIGSFGLNKWGGLSHTLEPNRYDASWENSEPAVRLAEEAGLDFILPLTHWSRHNSQTPTDSYELETLTWAAAVLAVTSRIRVYATVAAPFVHPLWAAKQAVTCNDIGKGRFAGLNIVSGFDPNEFAAFGREMLPHSERYEYTTEWAQIVKRLWIEKEPFDYEGKFFQLKNTQSLPPSREPIPALINAGSSEAGKAFVAQHADAWFTMIFRDEKGGFEGLADELSKFREQAGREINIYASGHIICRETEDETDAYYRSIVESGDPSAIEHFIEMLTAGAAETIPEKEKQKLGERFVTGMGTCLFRGTPEQIVEDLVVLRDAGLNGIALGMQNPIEDIPVVRDKLLPLMVKHGLRVGSSSILNAEPSIAR